MKALRSFEMQKRTSTSSPPTQVTAMLSAVTCVGGELDPEPALHLEGPQRLYRRSPDTPAILQSISVAPLR